MFTSKVTDSIANEYGSLAGYALQLLGNVYRQDLALFLSMKLVRLAFDVMYQYCIVVGAIA